MRTPRIRSPYGLIQEELRDEPWKLLIACMMLNLTNIKQVRPVIKEFFQKYPDPVAAANANEIDLAAMLKPLGLYNRRAKSIKKFSNAFMNDQWTSPISLPGIGKYANDSYEIFCNQNLSTVDPKDTKLVKYKEWAEGLNEN